MQPAILFLASIGLAGARTQEVLEAGPATFHLGAADEGASRTFYYESHAAGLLHVHARSDELDPRLEVFGPGVPYRDDDGGGGTTAFLRIATEPGSIYEIVVSGSPGDRGGSGTLVAVEAPEDGATRSAARAADESLAAVRRLRAESDQDGATAIDRLSPFRAPRPAAASRSACGTWRARPSSWAT